METCEKEITFTKISEVSIKLNEIEGMFGISVFKKINSEYVGMCYMTISIDKNIIKVTRPSPFDNNQSYDYDDKNHPRRKPFMETAMVFLREVKKISKEVIVEDFWGWGYELYLLKFIYEKNNFNPISIDIDNDYIYKNIYDKIIYEINEQLNHSNENFYYATYLLK